MLSNKYAKRNGAAFLVLLSASACGTYVPQIEEAYERGSLPKLERKIKEQIFCELQTSVQILNNDPLLRINVGGVDKTPLPQSWGVAITITLIVIENSSFNPSLSVMSPKPSQIFTIGLGGTLSAEATRTDTFTFYYLIKDLQAESEECALKDEAHPYGRTAADLQGSSLLLTSNLGILEWIKTAIGVRAGRGVGVRSKDEVLSYDVKFNIVTSGNVTPSWSLERVTTGTDNLFSAKRERTHELSLTFGPANDYPSVKGLSSTVSGPSQLVTNQILASQIRSALSTSVRRGFFDF